MREITAKDIYWIFWQAKYGVNVSDNLCITIGESISDDMMSMHYSFSFHEIQKKGETKYKGKLVASSAWKYDLFEVYGMDKKDVIANAINSSIKRLKGLDSVRYEKILKAS